MPPKSEQLIERQTRSSSDSSSSSSGNGGLQQQQSCFKSKYGRRHKKTPKPQRWPHMSTTLPVVASFSDTKRAPAGNRSASAQPNFSRRALYDNETSLTRNYRGENDIYVWATHLSVQNKRSPEQFVPQKICSMPCPNHCFSVACNTVCSMSAIAQLSLTLGSLAAKMTPFWLS